MMTEEQTKKNLRPLQFKDFPGQTKVKERLELFVSASQKRGEVLDHCLLFRTTRFR